MFNTGISVDGIFGAGQVRLHFTNGVCAHQPKQMLLEGSGPSALSLHSAGTVCPAQGCLLPVPALLPALCHDTPSQGAAGVPTVSESLPEGPCFGPAKMFVDTV